MKHVNSLINETSLYLLQHAHNPVNWYPWGPEALGIAISLDKPILVSIGYAACHWCHVMERESFEDEATALMMNEHFVCIKIDREERPDLDHLFIDALQAISGQGGWPLNMFLTSAGKPFYGGTYFPPQRFQNRVSWMELLSQIKVAYQTRRSEIEEQANHLTEHLQNTNKNDLKKLDTLTLPFEELFTKQQTEKIYNQLMAAADSVEGGFGSAPKFPQTYSIQYLLRYHHCNQCQPAFDQAALSLKKMMRGGIYDQIGGGFCRYSTDKYWLAPHFEKMTYDNALLVSVMAEAYQITNDIEYKNVINDTISFMKREMMNDEAGFYAAIDADSEGVEGKFYVWTKEEFDELLGDDAPQMADYFNVTQQGNWEHVNILRLKHSTEEWATVNNLDLRYAEGLVNKSKKILLDAREKRPRPATDDKVLLGWNALFNQTLTKSATALSDPDLLALAIKSMGYMLDTFYLSGEKKWKHTVKNGQAKFDAFLDDLAFLVQSLLYLYEPTGNLQYLIKAADITKYIIENFSDEDEVYFYFTSSFQNDILVRKKDLYDGAIPSGNAVMAWNLHRLAILLDVPNWKKRSENMVELQKDNIIKYPNSFGIWASLLLAFVQGTNEVLILGPGAAAAAFKFLKKNVPNSVLMAAETVQKGYPLMDDKKENDMLTYYLCKSYSCRLPVLSEEELMKQIAL
jgi:uncharacterized protein YyaL (SSP411 family)